MAEGASVAGTKGGIELPFRGSMIESDSSLRDEVNKRLTLNLLIQGSAEHAFLTSHHLVRDEINAINPKLIRLYDQIALGFFVQYWVAEGAIAFGFPDRFWKRTDRPKHPFHNHPFLARHGFDLLKSAKKYVFNRCRTKRVTRVPILFSLEFVGRILLTMYRERSHKLPLVDLAKRTTAAIWGIPIDKLHGELTQGVAFGHTRAPTNLRAFLLKACPAGYGGVMDDGAGIRVVAKAWVWPILSHELVKGTAELICLHGLNRLNRTTYDQVVYESDRIEYEPWMLQVGPELWRQFLAVIPADRPIAQVVMHVARLPPRDLEKLMFAIVEQKTLARRMLEDVGKSNGFD